MKDTSMKKYLGFVAVTVFLLSCTNTDRDNPFDERADNPIREGSSSSVRHPSSSSSSSVEPSSSSVEPSSSSVVSSSGSVEPSSSSSEDSCVGFVEGTKRNHLGIDKKQFCDERDGKKYVYVVIDNQTWMAENLNYNAYGSKCGDGEYLSDNNTESCDTYGRLYDWATAMGLGLHCNLSPCASEIQPKHRGICPSGWHIPSEDEWYVLINFTGDSETAGTKLKATSGWDNNGNGTDEFGFSALPGGGGYLSDNSFSNVKWEGVWWSATEDDSGGAYYRYMSDNNSDVGGFSYKTSLLFSVRCVQN